MNMWFAFVTCLLISSLIRTNAYCPNDEDLQHHHCTCSLAHGYIQCSSLPKQCRTCYRYNTIFFDEQVQFLPFEAFRNYDFFDSNNNQSFTIQFVQLNEISSNAFSKMDIDQDRTLSIKISKYLSSRIASRIFDEMTMQSKSNIDFQIFNVLSSLLTIEQYAFDGIRFGYESQFRFSILSSAESLEFESNAGSILMPSYSTMELYFSNFVRVILNEHSFDHITQEHSSQLQIHFDHFRDATLEHTSFFDLHQLDQSQFSLTFSNFQTLNIEQILFHSITQLQSSLIFSIYNMSNDFCLPSESFSQIKQDMNSTFRFEIDYAKNILFTPHAFRNISQRAQSKFTIMISNSLDVYFMNQSLKNFHQEDRSLIDIWMKYGQNLIFDNYAIENFDIWRSSITRIGFQYASGTLQMGKNAFVNINEGQGGELLFQMINSSDFYFRFNQSTTLERLEIVDRIFTNDDLCRISEIPAHLPVKLMKTNLCSCSVFYLYRQLRHILDPLILKDLTPLCYVHLSLDQIESEEKKCSFEKQIHNCQEMQGKVQIQIPDGICYEKLQSNSKMIHHSSSSFSLVLILTCFVFSLLCIYILSTPKRRFLLFNTISKLSCRRKLSLFTADSYEQLTQMTDRMVEEQLSHQMRKLVVKYNSATEQTQSDFIVSDEQENEDMTLKFNPNPLGAVREGRHPIFSIF